jgi:hypothetical protein
LLRCSFGLFRVGLPFKECVMPTKTRDEKGKEKVHTVMREYKEGKLKSGPAGKGGLVESRGQAVAIALSEARKAGAHIPDNPSK